MDMQLHFMAARNDRSDDIGKEIGAVDQGRHRIDEEHPGQAMVVKPVHHPADAVVTRRGAANDRRGEVIGQRDTLLVQSCRQFGIDRDQYAGHREQPVPPCKNPAR